MLSLTTYGSGPSTGGHSAEETGKDVAWIVYLFGKCVDVVWYEGAYTPKEIWNSLVYQYGYSVDIELQKPC